MARPLRIEYEGAVYHIKSRGNDRQDIFLDDEDRLSFLNAQRRGQVFTFGWRLAVEQLPSNSRGRRNPGLSCRGLDIVPISPGPCSGGEGITEVCQGGERDRRLGRPSRWGDPGDGAVRGGAGTATAGEGPRGGDSSKREAGDPAQTRGALFRHQGQLRSE